MSAMLAETGPDKAPPGVEPSHRERKRVIIIGAGFAGIAAARALRHADVDVVLIDRRNHHIARMAGPELRRAPPRSNGGPSPERTRPPEGARSCGARPRSGRSSPVRFESLFSLCVPQCPRMFA